MEIIGKVHACEVCRSITGQGVNAESPKPPQHAFQHNFTNQLFSNALPHSKYCQCLRVMLYTHRINMFPESLYPVSTKLSTQSRQKYFMDLFLHEILQSFLPICSVDECWPLGTQLACNAMYIPHTQSPRQTIPPHPPTHTHTHTHTQRKENFSVTIIHKWYLLSGNTVSAGSHLIFELLLHTHLHINHKTNL
jgi:hypothetical protein